MNNQTPRQERESKLELLYSEIHDHLPSHERRMIMREIQEEQLQYQKLYGIYYVPKSDRKRWEK